MCNKNLCFITKIIRLSLVLHCEAHLIQLFSTFIKPPIFRSFFNCSQKGFSLDAI